jgi:sigma-B regulation protein RsbU (phosphoserine phosphatase)
MAKRPYPSSFAKRLTWRIMLTLLLVMGFVSVAIFYAGWGMAATAVQVITNHSINSLDEKISHVTSDIYVASVNTIPQIEENLDKPEKMYDIMERMVRQNPRIRSCGISFIADYYPQKGRWFCPYALRVNNDTIDVKTLGDRNHDYLNKEWFTQAVATEEGFWSKPFFDGMDKKTPLVSWLAPIHDKQGKTVAVLGVDLPLDELLKNIEFTRIGDPKDDDGNWDAQYVAYVFVIDSTGTYIVHPDRKRMVRENYFDYAKLSPDPFISELGKKMIKGEEGHTNSGSNGQDLVIEGEKVNVDYMPIKQLNWSVAIVIPMLYINVVGYILGTILITLIAIGLLVVFFVGRSSIKKAVKPLKQLAVSADEVAKGNFHTPLPIIKRKDEICQLRDSFEKMQHSLTAYIDELKATTAQKASMESELKVAHDIQMSMLPKTFPPYPERHDIDIYGKLKPAKDVGGDLFDFFIRDEHLFFCIGDVSGKGVPASLVMAVTRSLFRNISAHLAEPHMIVHTLNKAMTDGNETNMFVTLFVGVLDLATGRLAYSNAGHDAPLLISQDVSTIACDANLPIGVMANQEYTLQETELQPGSTIFLFTDGLNEAEDILHDQFGDQRIHDVATSLLADGQPKPDTLINAMTEAVHTFVGEAEQSDDLTMLAIRYLKD